MAADRLLGRGAEASVYRHQDHVRKVREPKPYRHPDLDMKLRKFRTRREASVLRKIPVTAPQLLAMDDEEMTLSMEFVDAPMVKDVVDAQNADDIASRIGQAVRGMHDAGIIHGDLTTSNMLLDDSLVLIDFGLSFFSDHVEDKATDLHLLKQACNASHPSLRLFATIWSAYGPDEELVERFERVELRGRYKGK